MVHIMRLLTPNNCLKPVLLVCPEGAARLPLWYRGFIKREHMFGSWNEVYVFLDKGEAGEMKNHKRWTVYLWYYCPTH